MNRICFSTAVSPPSPHTSLSAPKTVNLSRGVFIFPVLNPYFPVSHFHITSSTSLLIAPTVQTLKSILLQIIMSGTQYVDKFHLNRGKRRQLESNICVQERKKSGRRSHRTHSFNKCPICSGKCHMCSVGSLGCTALHSFSLTSTALPRAETQDLQCSGLARFTSSSIYHHQRRTVQWHSPGGVKVFFFNNNSQFVLVSFKIKTWGTFITVYLLFKPALIF